MKVSDLIERLRKMPQDAKVGVHVYMDRDDRMVSIFDVSVVGLMVHEDDEDPIPTLMGSQQYNNPVGGWADEDMAHAIGELNCVLIECDPREVTDEV